MRGLQTGGGASANSEAGPLSVKELKSSLPFIDKVFNVQSASAGASPWTIEQFEAFGPQSIKNRGRAVTREDYEWMIRQQFSDVARVRCLPVTEPGPGGTLQFKAGGVTALIVPFSGEPRPQPAQGLMRKVREYLTHVVLSNITTDVHVKGPDYHAVDIETVLVPTHPEYAMVVARKAQSALDAFLHPLTGGEDRKGYGFGRPVFLSEAQAVLERIEEVDHVVSARFVSAPDADVFSISENRLASPGVHRITARSAEA
jgi:predicted phage baseplate assembly protein